MIAYFYIERGQVKRVNLSPTEYNEESKKHTLYTTREEARRAKR